jgi:hypothetical protein
LQNKSKEIDKNSWKEIPADTWRYISTSRAQHQPYNICILLSLKMVISVSVLY